MSEHKRRRLGEVDLSETGDEALDAIKIACGFASDAEAVRCALWILGDRVLGSDLPLDAFEVPYRREMRALLDAERVAAPSRRRLPRPADDQQVPA